MAADSGGAPPVARHAGRPLKGLLGIVLKVGVAGGLLVYVFSRVDFRAVSRVISTVNPLMLALALALACLSFPLGGVRWWCIVRALGDTASPRLLTGLFWLAGLVAQVVPNPMGDAVRISVAARMGLGLGTAFRSAFLERVVMLAGLVILMAATQPILRARLGVSDLAWLAIAFGAGALGGLVLLATADLLLWRFRRLRFVDALVSLSAGFRRLIASHWLAPVLSTVFISHLNTILVAIVLGAALDLPLSASDYLAAIPVAILAVVLPVSIGGWGMREGVMLALLGAMGVPAPMALAFSLMLGLIGMVAALPGLVMLWHQPGKTAGPQ